MTYMQNGDKQEYEGMDFFPLPTGSYAVSDPGFEAAVIGESDARAQGRAAYTHLAPVNFIDPKLLEDVNGGDEHPPSVPANGQRLAHRVVQALMKNPEVWKRSVLFITYDEHGGFYDHVSPPPACEPDNLLPKWRGRYGGSANAVRQACLDANGEPIADCGYLPDNTDKKYGGAFNRYGARVPAMVVSPWAKRQFVSHRTYDHTSILRFIEARFGLPTLTRRDANADPMLDFFDFRDRDAKLNGTYNATWGKETVPTEFAIQVDGNVVNSVDGAADLVPDVCKQWFKPDPNGVNYGEHVYLPRDCSDGISPPPTYLFDASENGIGEAKIRR